MATIICMDPSTGLTRKTITLSMEASMVIQDLLGEIEFFVTLSTSAKDVLGNEIAKETVTSLGNGAGGAGLDRVGSALPNAGKYASLTTAINDYVSMMVEGRNNEPWTEMAFN